VLMICRCWTKACAQGILPTAAGKIGSEPLDAATVCGYKGE